MEKRAIPFVLALYALVFAVGIGLSVTHYRDGGVLHEETVAYLDDGISVYAGIASLRGLVATQESILYEYYATTDRSVFMARWEDNQRAIEAHWRDMSQKFEGHPRSKSIEDTMKQIQTRSVALDQVLRGSEIDWDKARELLKQVTEHSLVISTSLSALADDMQQRMHEYRKQVQERIAVINTTARYYIAAILVIAILVGYFLRAYLSGIRERQRLAMFVERNPNPVLRLTREGEVDYANPGAWATLMSLGVSVETPLTLLPTDVQSRIKGMVDQGSDWAHWQYAVLGKEYEANVHYLKDYGSFHVYLRDVTERVMAERRLEYIAYHDHITDLPNRRRLVTDVQEAITRGGKGAILLINIERTQRIIDSIGHGVADRLYQVLSRRLAQVVMDFSGSSPGARVYRYEGEIFCVSMPNFGSPGMPSQLAMEIVAKFNEPLLVDSYELFLGASIGCCHYPADGQNAISIISQADQALQQIKGAGGGFRVYESGLSAAARERLMLENHLRHALERGELNLVYQPQVALATGSIIGVEALLRWDHPVLGPLPPSRFIPIAEETGLILSIGEWILRKACFQAKTWNAIAGMSPIRIAINISARQFISKDIIRTIAGVLEQSGLPPQYLEVEVTESLTMDDVPHSIEMLRDLKSLGVGIALDDFGTGYSSLSYLRQFPLDRLKIDRSFVSNVESESGDATLVRSIVELGHSLNMQVTAEGIESQEQYEFLRDIGCEEAQGFYFSRPVTAAAFEKLIRRGGREWSGRVKESRSG